MPRYQTMGMKGLLNRPRTKTLKGLATAIEQRESDVRNYEVRPQDKLQELDPHGPWGGGQNMTLFYKQPGGYKQLDSWTAWRI